MNLNPLLTCPGIQERGRNLVHLSLRNHPQVVAYRFFGQQSVNGAYGNPLDSGVLGAGSTLLFTVNRGEAFRSPSLRRSGRGQVAGNIRGTTHAVFNPEDYASAAGFTSDSNWVFVRVQENRVGTGLLSYAGVPEATIELNGVQVGDQVVIKGIVFEFAAGANDLLLKTGTALDPFIVGLGADDDAAAANLTAALNDEAEVGVAMDAVAPTGSHTFGTLQAGPSVLVQPESGPGNPLSGTAYEFDITTSDQGRLTLDAAALAAGHLVWEFNEAVPVLGPIFCIPPAIHFGARDPSFSLFGTAPSLTGSAAGSLPNLSEDRGNAGARAMHLVFPTWLREVSIRNLSLANLLVSLGPTQPMRVVPAGEVMALTSGNATVREVVLACPGAGGANFSFHAVSMTGS